ncbi:hypothetical protein AB0N09_40440 [Streptomyces erythrochromogenes]|uniref:hypothetical protein n=1 Tax=Streptomyces erythrochromogenes TaxID=285574 RepID=UPI0034125A41
MIELENLEWTSISLMDGTTGEALRVLGDDFHSGGGVYFVYFPDTDSMGHFSTSDDMVVETAHDWALAVFLPDPQARRTEVRYGDLSDIAAARVVASCTTC